MSFACEHISLFLDAWDYIVQNVKLTNKGKNTVMLLLLLNVPKNKDVILIHCDTWNEMYEDRTFYQMIKIIVNLESILAHLLHFAASSLPLYDNPSPIRRMNLFCVSPMYYQARPERS